MSTTSTSTATATAERFELRPGERRVVFDGQPVALGSRAFDLLSVLVAHRDRVVTKDELLDRVWPGLVVEENNLQVQISALRKVLGTQAISTVAGVGYRFTLAAAAGQAGASAGNASIVGVPAATTTLGAARALGRPGHAAMPHTSAAHLLVVEDNKVTRLLLGRTLELHGHRVDLADNGRLALEMLRRGGYDLLLLDLELPELDGFGLLQARAQDAVLQEVPVIVTSALDGVDTVARCIELGADDYLHKPVNPVLLKARLASSLAGKRLRDLQRGRSDSAAATETRQRETTVMVARLHALDTLAQAQPGLAIELMNNWCTLMFDAIEEHGGQVAQSRGDGLLALFDAPLAALKAARDMADMSRSFNAEAGSAAAAMHLAIGLARGAVLVGTAGSTRHLACACVGEAVQRAGQLEEAGHVLGHGLLMDAAMQAAWVGQPMGQSTPQAARPVALTGFEPIPPGLVAFAI